MNDNGKNSEKGIKDDKGPASIADMLSSSQALIIMKRIGGVFFY
jgi:hypothetical protein